MEITIGIDLGTTNTVVFYMKNGRPTPIKFKGSGNMLPSIIYVDEDGSVLVGNAAKSAYYGDAPNGVRSSKTYMGDAGKKWICRGRKFTPTDVATEILKFVRQEVVKKFKGDESTIINAVITVPAEFKSTQIDETKKAGEAAGLKVVRIITEPMAAAVAAVTDMETNGKIMVVDFGGGTFDLALLAAEGDNYKAVVRGGDRQLGGDRFDSVLEKYLLNRISDDTGKDLSTCEKSGIEYNLYWSMLGRLRSAAVTAKENLSNSTETDINLANLFPFEGEMYGLDIQLTRAKFDELSKDIYAEVFKYIDEFVDRGNIKAQDLNEIILAGGSCFIPYIRENIEKRFNKHPNMELDPSILVSYGACLVADHEMHGLESAGATTKYQDIISHSLGVEVIDERNVSVLSKILLENAPYPCAKTKLYTTVYDNQQEIAINVYEAGSHKENVLELEGNHDLYGSMILDGIKPAPQGRPCIAVTFSYDKNRVLTVTATDITAMNLGFNTNEDKIHELLKNLSPEERTKYPRKQLRILKGQKAKTPKRQRPVDFMLLVDSSGSMTELNAMDQAKRACHNLIDQMIDFSIHRMGIISFGTAAQSMIGLGNDKAAMGRAIDSITPRGSTNMIDALNMAADALYRSTNDKVIIMVTDGYPYPASDYSTISVANSVRQKGILIAAIGAGEGVSESFLQQIANQGNAYHIENMKSLQATFKTAISNIMERR